MISTRYWDYPMGEMIISRNHSAPREVSFRVKAQLRRQQYSNGMPRDKHMVYAAGMLSVDMESGIACKSGKVLNLTGMNFYCYPF